jgi:serine/threonine-protein kinase
MLPETIGRYQIECELGRGAMGRVYLAHDPTIGRRLAVKTIPLDRSTPELRARFQREAQAAGRLIHPNIVTIFDAGEHDGQLFLAMELVEGETLADTIAAGPLDAAQSISVGLQLAAGLEHAHQQGIVHRDIKSANVMVAGATAKIMDFGVARLASAGLTATGQLLGTPAYLAPEVIRGETADARSDIFSLGVVLYECLTGHRPFDGDNISAVMYQVVNVTPAVPEAPGSGVPAALSALVMKAIEKDPANRFRSAGELAGALQECRAECGMSAAAPVVARGTRKLPVFARGPVATPAQDVSRTIVAPSAAAEPTPSPVRPGNSSRSGALIAAGLALAAGIGFWSMRSPDAPGGPPEPGDAAPENSPAPAAEPPRPRAASAPATAPREVPAAPAPATTPLPEAVPVEIPAPASAPASMLAAVPEPPPAPITGTLQVTSTPPGARILVNDRATGQVTPADIPLTPGRHKVRLEADGFSGQNRNVEIDAGETLLLNVEMKKGGLLRRINPF